MTPDSTVPSDTDRLAEIQTRLDAATPGPWSRRDFMHRGLDDADLAAWAPTDLEYLLKRVRLLEQAYGHAKEQRAKYERRVIEWREAAELAAKERDAYKRAKQENDDRFLNERDEARAEVQQLRGRLDTAEGQLAKAADYTNGPVQLAIHRATCEDSLTHCSENRGRCVRSAEAAAWALGLGEGDGQ